jgi:hypothetical protein
MTREPRSLFESTVWETFMEGLGLALMVGAVLAFFSLLGR